MGLHLLCNDGLGRCMAIFAYIIMGLGNLMLFISVINPKLGTEDETSALIEYACYVFFWTMMVLSHMSTMCVDPGFIPKNYVCNEENLASPFKTLAEL